MEYKLISNIFRLTEFKDSYSNLKLLIENKLFYEEFLFPISNFILDFPFSFLPKNENFNKDKENNIPNIGGISNAKQVESNMQSPGNVVGDIQKLNQEHDFNKVNSSVDSVSKKLLDLVGLLFKLNQLIQPNMLLLKS